MNSESYSECIVQTVRPKWVIPAVAGMVLSLGAFIYFLLCMNIWLELLSAAIFGILLFLVYRYGSVEYEYLYILDELTIAKIFRKRSRKDAVSVSMQEVEPKTSRFLDVLEKKHAESQVKLANAISFSSYRKEDK